MPHMLARLRNVRLEIIRSVLENDKDQHAKEGMYFEHLWQNVDDENEVLFLFRLDNLDKTKAFISRVHSEALKADPKTNLPTMTFLS